MIYDRHKRFAKYYGHGRPGFKLTSSASASFDRDVVETVYALFGNVSARTATYSKQTNACGGAAYFVHSPGGAVPALPAALDDALPAADGRIVGSEPTIETDKGMLSYPHKVWDGRNIYFIANSPDQREDTELKLRGQLTLQRRIPHTGGIAPLATTGVVEHGQHFARAQLQLEPVKPVLRVESSTPSL